MTSPRIPSATAEADGPRDGLVQEVCQSGLLVALPFGVFTVALVVDRVLNAVG